MIHPYAHYTARAARRWPDRVALIDGPRRRSYLEVDARATQIARALIGLGLAPGERVAVVQENCVEYVEVVIAIARAGGVVVPLLGALTASEHAFMVSDAEARFVVALRAATVGRAVEAAGQDADVLALASASQSQDLAALAKSESREPPDRGSPAGIAGPDPLYVRNDGSSQRRDAQLCERVGRHGCLGDGVQCRTGRPRAGPAGPQPFRGPRNGRVLGCGGDPGDSSRCRSEGDARGDRATPRHDDPGDPDAAPDAPRPSRCGRRGSFESSRRRLRRCPRCPRARAPISRTARARSAHGFGQTEAYGLNTFMGPDEHVEALESSGDRLSSVGRECAGFAQVRICGEDGQDVARGETGEICVWAPWVTPGFWKRSDLDRDRLRDGWLRTGRSRSNG